MPSRSQLTLAILAGGAGSRLGGVPKGLLRIDGETTLARLVKRAHGFAEVLVIANDPEPYRDFGLRVVPDVLAGRGAPGGLHAALIHARTERVALVAADMPFVEPAALELLDAECRAGARLACFEVDGTLEPLLGVYARALAPELEVLLGGDRAPSFRALFERLGGVVLPSAKLATVDPSLRSVVSLNTPDDLLRWNAELPEGRKPAQLPTRE